MIGNHEEGIIGENHIFTKVSNYLIVTNWLNIIALGLSLFFYLKCNIYPYKMKVVALFHVPYVTHAHIIKRVKDLTLYLV